METQDDTLFSKSVPLLTTSSELAYHTVNCSALNAEELRRENGIEVSDICTQRRQHLQFWCSWARIIFYDF